MAEVEKIPNHNPAAENPKRMLGRDEKFVITVGDHSYQEKELKSDGSWKVFEEGRGQHAIRAITRSDTNQYFPVHYDGRAQDIGENNFMINDERYHLTAQRGFLTDAIFYTQP